MLRVWSSNGLRSGMRSHPLARRVTDSECGWQLPGGLCVVRVRAITSLSSQSLKVNGIFDGSRRQGLGAPVARGIAPEALPVACRRTASTVPRSHEGSPQPAAAPAEPVKKTELKKKKAPAGDAAGHQGAAQSAGRTDTPAPALTTGDKALMYARKALVDFPKLALMKTYEFFRLMILGACVRGCGLSTSGSPCPLTLALCLLFRGCGAACAACVPLQSPRYSKPRRR